MAVVGAGIMGANHARVLHTMSQCDLVAVVDEDVVRGRAVSEASGCDYLSTTEELLGLVDAVVVATPTPTHASVGQELLRAGVDVLIEKPLASSPAECHLLVQAAVDSGQLLMAGHIERFNPAVLELMRLADDPVHMEFTRIGPFSPRVSSDVVLDLMIHDIDLALSLARADVTSVSALGRSVVTDSLDVASALISFGNGVTATLTASRVAQTKVRQVEVTQREAFIAADLVRQDVTISRLHHSEFLSERGPTYRQTGLIEIPFLEQRGEPLALELTHFVECVTERRAPLVGGEEGRRALEIAYEVRRSAGF